VIPLLKDGVALKGPGLHFFFLSSFSSWSCARAQFHFLLPESIDILMGFQPRSSAAPPKWPPGPLLFLSGVSRIFRFLQVYRSVRLFLPSDSLRVEFFPP